MSTLPEKGPVLLENTTKALISINYMTGMREVTQANRAHTHDQVNGQIILGASIDRDQAKLWARQNAENEKQRLDDPSIPSLDRREKVHPPEMTIPADVWKLMMATPSTKSHLAGLVRQRRLRAQRA